MVDELAHKHENRILSQCECILYQIAYSLVTYAFKKPQGKQGSGYFLLTDCISHFGQESWPLCNSFSQNIETSVPKIILKNPNLSS